ncbi:ATP-binding protein [Lusitaniella coriacea LEGE 07157]|uniref:ATP-binding protein n=1 Tax=Lusitaniella coriacea LEGE 07157 TaxID=945747 RepID=A0A8J7DVZ3_9CYAN|nr:ATP-binding protein [Lusitaniella coriacea]MBE9115773.1 ATP-binding protein [Lusitaniella coriacea LEGE 07157]
MNSDSRLLKDLFNSFKPDMPLEPGDTRYVDCNSVRGDEDVTRELGGYITKDENNTYQLYSGHRGGGKSTELKRLRKYLEDSGCVVVYFAAATEDAGDLSFQDTQYQDILLSCTRQLLEKLKDRADSSPIQNWLRDRWKELIDLALTEVSLDKLDLSVALSQLAKITAAVRTEPNKRREIRKLVEPNTESLVQALNEFIRNAKSTNNRIVIIADNLDRIVQTQPEEGAPTNLEDIFINRSELMRGLDCHIVYTAPISLLYSTSSSELQNIYGKIQILPMVMVQSQDGSVWESGMKKLRIALEKRVSYVEERELVPQIFDTEKTVQLLCFSCGGHLRDLMHIARDAVNQTTQLPIPEKAVKRAITKFRRGYMEALRESEWALLLKVHETKQRLNEDAYRNLLNKRCILEYCFFDDDDERISWYDVHPLIRGSKLFKERWANYQTANHES